MDSEKIKISVVIPCYNEEKRIEKTIISIKKFFFRNRKLFDYELIIVDDGSTDMTFDIVKDMNLTIMRYGDNKGKGYAVRRGLLKTKYKNILVLDADLSVKPIELLGIFGLLQGGLKYPKLVIGDRIQIIQQPKYRLFLGWGFRFLTRIILSLEYKDTQCPYKIFMNFDREFIRSLKIDGFSYDVELLHKTRKEGIPIIEQDVEYMNFSDSKVTIKKTIRMFFDLLRIRFIL